MERYIDADALMKKIVKCKFHLTGYGIVYDAGEVQSVIRTMPTADVAPKSEVERLNNELIIWKQDRFNLYQRLDLYEKAREKVAREIFEEIEEMLISSSLLLDCTMLIDAEMLAELKKKYTGGDE